MMKKVNAMIFTLMMLTVPLAGCTGDDGPVDVLGCKNTQANNYNENVTKDDGTCDFDLDDDGVLDADEILGCMDSTANNYNLDATDADDSCDYDLDDDGTEDSEDDNILYNTQLIAGLATGIDYGGTFAKAGFANNMISFELQNKAPSIWSANEISNSVDINGGTSVLENAYLGWNTSTSAGIMTPNFTSSIDMIMDGAVSDTGICIALTCEIGPMLVAGMGVPSSSTTAVRSALYGYSDVSEPELTHIDWSVYSLAATVFSNHGGGADLTEVDNLKERLEAVTESVLGSPISVDNPASLEYLLFGINAETGNAAGMLMESDFFGIPLNGVALFLLGASGSPFDAMFEYGLGLTQLLGLVDYSGRWLAYDNALIGSQNDFPMILVGKSGTLNANEWWLESFGGNEPINNGYLFMGMNRAAFEGTINLSSEKANEILYTGAYALTGDFATAFMYGELSGLSLPMTATGPMAGGEQVVWDNAYVASIYGISEEEAAALKSWVIDFMFPAVVPALLNFQYAPINNWLYGWDDAVLAGLGIDSWVTLETNETYFGAISDNDSDGDGVGDNADSDDDNDGILDINDPCPISPYYIPRFWTGQVNETQQFVTAFDMMIEYGVGLDALLTIVEQGDTDNDGCFNLEDADDDGDGTEDSEDAFPLDSSRF